MLKLISRLLVPSCCVLCDKEGCGLCGACCDDLEKHQEACYLCNAIMTDGRVCSSCQWRTRLRRATILWNYQGKAGEVVRSLKYAGREDVARVIAKKITEANLPYYDIITFVPDTPARRRGRGHMAPQLIARELSRITHKPYVELLSRTIHTPQVGAGREVRWRQVRGNFLVKHPTLLDGRRILLVDDVITTGATITECARVLKLAGSGPVFAAAAVKG